MQSDHDFRIGVIVGAIITVLVLLILEIAVPHTADANRILNSDDYKIDTVTIIHNADTVYKYKFVKFK